MTEQEQATINKYDLLFESRLSKTEEALGHLDKTIDRIDASIIRLDHTMQEGFKELRSDYKWMFRITLGFTAVILCAMAKGFHWYI